MAPQHPHLSHMLNGQQVKEESDRYSDSHTPPLPNPALQQQQQQQHQQQHQHQLQHAPPPHLQPQQAQQYQQVPPQYYQHPPMGPMVPGRQDMVSQYPQQHIQAQQQQQPAPAPQSAPAQFGPPQPYHQGTPYYDNQQPQHVYDQTSDRRLKRRQAMRPTRTRKKTMVACETCRLKKIRCTNEKPVCQSCINNGFTCVYREETLKDAEESSSATSSKKNSTISDRDPLVDSSTLILNKLDAILDHVSHLPKAGSEPAQQHYITPVSTDVLDAVKTSDALVQGRWYASSEFILQWPCFQSRYKTRPILKTLSKMSNSPKMIVSDYNEFTDLTLLEAFSKKLIHNLLYFVNSYVNNVHTKAPVIDLAKLYMTVDLICERRSLNCIPEDKLDTYYPVSIPIFIAALGVLVAPLSPSEKTSHHEFHSSLEQLSHLDRYNKFMKNVNFARFKELEERDRYRAHNPLWQLNYCVSEFLKKTCYLYLLKPLEAWDCLQRASSMLIRFLKTNDYVDVEGDTGDTMENDEYSNIPVEDRKLVERLYWIIYKEESELRVELSPHIASVPSEILNFPAPSSFPVPVLFDTSKVKVSRSTPDDSTDSDEELIDTNDCTVVREQNDSIWYCFLNEVALRKLENNFLEDLYSDNPNKMWNKMFADPDQLNLMLLKIGGYIADLDNIVDKLHPAIKQAIAESNEEILQDIEETRYQPIDSKYSPTANENNKKIPIFKLFEAIVFTKTRIVTIKMLLSRPVFYYISLLATKEELIAFVSIPAIAQLLRDSFSLANIANPELMKHRHNGSWYVLRNLFVGSLYILVAMPNLLKYPEVGEALLAALDGEFNMPSKETMSFFVKGIVSILGYWAEEAPEFYDSIDIISRYAAEHGF